MTNMPRDLMTPQECAEELGVSARTLANNRSQDKGLPYVRLPGGRIRYSRAEINKRLAEATVRPAA